MGSATCLHLARRGVSLTGIDQYVWPRLRVHARRHAHHPPGGRRGAEYIPLVQRSHRLWRELEAESGARLLTQCGSVILSRPGSPFFERTRALAAQFRIEHEHLDNGQLRRRLPMFATDEETEAYYEPAAGNRVAGNGRLDPPSRSARPWRRGDRRRPSPGLQLGPFRLALAMG